MRYDVFISHASEDKDAIARPLAEALSSFGVRVWFDELTLKLGDSLSRSIDTGLIQSNFGLVILSPAFFAKNWPEYELRGLTAKEHSGGKVILPIWHQVDFNDVIKYSPPLADKLAVKACNKSSDEIALEIIGIIRPDILTKIHKRIAHLEAIRQAELRTVSPEEYKTFKFSGLKHKDLPPALTSRIRLIRATLLEVYPHSMKFWIDGFRADAHPSQQVMWWEHVASCYLEYVQAVQLESHEQHHAAYDVVFGIMCSGKATDKDLKEKLKLLPKGAYKKIQGILKYQYPLYDVEEDFPIAGVEMSEEEHDRWLSTIDLEDFGTIDRQE